MQEQGSSPSVAVRRISAPDTHERAGCPSRRFAGYFFIVVVAMLLFMSRGQATSPGAAMDAAPQQMMTAADLQRLPALPPDYRIPYGDDPNQFGELRLPSGPGPHPVVVLLHGGCWKAQYASLRDLGPMGDALKADGIASWNVEYRRLPQPGSGWPGTYLDVGRAVDHLRSIEKTHALDLERVVVLGHSAGGHLAMWTAIRPRIRKDGALFQSRPLPVRGVVNLAGTIDMADNIANLEAVCGDPVVSTLLGGTPAQVPERYRAISAINMLPLRVPQILIWGDREDNVPQPVVEKYVRAAQRAGDDVQLRVLPGVGHFETASPVSPTWPAVRAAIRSLLEVEPRRRRDREAR